MHFRIDGNGYNGNGNGGVDAVGGAGISAGAAMPGHTGPLSSSNNAVSAADFHPAHLHGGSQRSRSSSSDPRHLTGEMIRQMNALKQKDSATIVASLADCQRQQLQMQAIYERALRVSNINQ